MTSSTPNLPAGMAAVTPKEALSLGAADTSLFGQFFFPQTCRQAAPFFHKELYSAADSINHRFVAAMIARGFAKTSCARIITMKRISYAISRTNLFVGKSQGASAKTLMWVRRQMEFNTRWTQTFGLRKGDKWSDEWLQIIHEPEDVVINLVAAGITGSVRGINLDDYRPDLILVDDPCDEENTGTPEQREKTADLFFGSLQNSLAPEVDNPWAKMILLQTPLNKGDLINETFRDPQWYCLRYSCFDENGQSIWEERRPTKELLLEKEGFVARNKLSLWLREMECRVVSRETATFLPEWYQPLDVYPEQGLTIVAVDPTPPASKSEARDSAKLRRRDDAVIVVLRLYAGKVFILDGYAKKSPQTEELINEMFRLAIKWNCTRIKVETILFARTISEYLTKEMIKRRVFFHVQEVEDRRAKPDRIDQEISKRASNGLVYFAPHLVELKEQFETYPDSSHDDWLDAVSIGLSNLNIAEENVIEGEYWVHDDKAPQLPEFRSCP